jgi:hypothetical protein
MVIHVVQQRIEAWVLRSRVAWFMKYIIIGPEISFSLIECDIERDILLKSGEDLKLFS